MSSRPGAIPDLSSAPVEDVVRYLDSNAFDPDLHGATVVRDRAAQLLGADPTRARALATALERAVSRAGERVDAATRAVSLRCQAEACLYTGRLELSRRCYEAAAAEANAAGDDRLRGQILVGWIGLLSVMGETRASAKLVPRARQLLERVGDRVYLGKLYMNLGNVAYNGERYRDAFESYRRAADVFEEAGLRDATWVTLLVNQAVASTNLSRIGEARALFRKAEAHAGELGLGRVAAQSQFNLAHLEGLRGDYRQSLALLETAGRRFDELEIRDMVAATERSRAELYLELGMPVESCELASRAADSFAREGMVLDASICRVIEARGRLLQGSPGDALTLLDKAAGDFGRGRLWPRRASTRLHAARAMLALDDPRGAARLARSALITFRRRGSHRFVAEAGRVIAEARLMAGQAAAAERALREADRHLTALSPGERSEVSLLKGRIATARGRRSDAIRHLRRAVTYLEAQRHLIPGVEYRARAFERQVGAYRDLVGALVESGDAAFDDVFELVEAARARGFRDRALNVAPEARDGIVERRARLGSLTRRLEEIEYTAPGGAASPEARAIRREVRSLEKELAEEIRRADAAASRAGRGRRSTRASSVMRALGEDAALVEYFALDGRLLALIVRQDRCEMRVLPQPIERVAAGVRAVRFQMDTMAMTSGSSGGNPAFMRRAGEKPLRELHEALIDPVADLLPRAGRLFIVPHDFLHHVPFECLHDGHDYIDARWVINRCPTADTVATSPGPGNERTRGPAGTLRAIVAGTVKNGPPFVATEIAAVASRLPGNRVRVLRDPTTAELLASVTDCDVIHLSAHGVFREDNPMFSRIATGDGALFMADILAARLSADVVVLSACNSGQAFTGRGDDLSGVAHAFLAAGARQLVAGHWRVHDEATRSLMEAFYDEYVGASRGDAALALSRAGRRIRERWDHPFYWGSFGAHGV